jgi:hypothetical protein
MQDEPTNEPKPVNNTPVFEVRASGKGYVTKKDGTVVPFQFEGKVDGNDSDAQ